ncbi:MAG: aminoacyl-histidine dipeptidase [Candidatus Heimdallarchaeota archaeon]|nr:MAG: aminoacyl-histidine dipeptidase [Candidatus Heimdallarchaeota archaeon]
MLEGLEPQIVWDLFEKISQIPRESKKEEKIRAWIKTWAEKHKIAYNEDNVGNLLLSRSTLKGCDHFPGVILQAHMDMVGQKLPESSHDFDHDPITLKVVENYVTADGTTLGADNGIGLAMCLAVLVDPDFRHGPLDVLLTVDEETGFTGAFALQPNFFNHNLLLNLDSEDVGTITVSSAGGGDTRFVVPVTWKENSSLVGFRLEVRGLTGGHSGIDIHKPRLNALKLLTEVLINIRQKVNSFHICSIVGGSAHNAIPRDAWCEFLVDNAESVRQIFREWDKQFETYRKDEPNLRVNLHEEKLSSYVTSTNAIITLLYEIPHGPLSFSQEIPDLVETSNNLALIKTSSNTIEIVASTRSSIDGELNRVRDELRELAERVNAEVIQGSTYPGWKPALNSPFLKLVKQEYEREYGREVKLKAIHAGLETGVFKGINPVLQLVSIGPDIKDVHSPQERVYIESVGLIWRVVTAVLSRLDQI